jgi:hypothetical protein
MSIAPEVERSKEATNKTYTSDGSSGSTASAEVCLANQSGKPKKNKSRRYKRKLQKPNGSHGYEGLLSLIQGMLRSMANMDMTRKPSPRVKQVWVKKDETIHPLKGSRLT